MAAYTLDLPPTSGGQTVAEFMEGVRVIKWILTSADPNGTSYVSPNRSEKTVHIYGTIGTATVAIQGSLESGVATPVNLVTLHSPDHVKLSFATLPQLETVLEHVWWIAPSLTTPGAGATVTVELQVFTVARR